MLSIFSIVVNSLLGGLVTIFGLKQEKNVSKNNRLAKSYLYGLDEVVSSNNRLSYVIAEELEIGDSIDET